uniref:Cytochrome P450 n=1 Tax=Centaurium erythraea TaxID=172057 RepID=Q6PLI3_CENER|nr:cytochrome P450 [Centaurium erythraea]
MDVIFPLLVAFITWAIASSLTFRRFGRLPPGPFPVPVIGNIHQLGKHPNQSLAKLSKIYGPLMSLKLGTQTAIVASSSTVVREILQKHDQVFSSRTIPSALHAHDHHKFSMALLPASSRWRHLRKITKEQMFSVQRLDESQGLRQDKLKELRDYLHSCCVTGQAVNIGEAAFTTTLNLMSCTLFSVNFASFDSKFSDELKRDICAFVQVIAAPNLADFSPVLRHVDPQGLLKRTKTYMQKVFDSFEDIITKRLQERGTSQQDSLRRHDLLEALLDEMEKNDSAFTINDMKHLILDLFIAGADSTSSTTEWGMAELLHNPEKMEKAKAELNEVIGQKNLVEESDISRLPYLQAVVKEVFRLHPPGPLLVPHKADADVEIDGYVVPKNANVLVNVWALGRDSSSWADPEAFMPERFLDNEIDVKGQHFELIPFGAGRRMCPGLPLSYRMLH